MILQFDFFIFYPDLIETTFTVIMMLTQFPFLLRK